MILGVRVHTVSVAESAAILDRMAASGRGHLVIPVNPEMIIAAQKNREFRDALNGASLVLPDGTGVKVAARLHGHSGTDRVTGVDTVDTLARIAVRRGLRLFLLGAQPGIAERAGEALQARHPGLVIAGCFAGSPTRAEEDDICRRVAEARADILMIAYGAPKQELWCVRNLARLPVRIAMCVGGSFDFLAGRTSRAPAWMQRMGLEWLYRLVQEPRRWRRMLALQTFAVRALAERAAISTTHRNP
jgi:N-acetylglucosaminyldiphosphoundecaprenol N-acetyl-beta-D-mannosaminyltransferase